MSFKDFLKEKKWRRWKKDQWLIFFLAGILVLVIAMPSGAKENNEIKDGSDEKKQSEPQVVEDDFYEERIETRLEDILHKIHGAGKVEVMITLKNHGESVVEKDVQRMSEQVSEVTVYEDQTEEGGPFVAKEIVPEIEGVLVVAQGGGNAIVAQNISEAVQALFDIEIHKIKIVKMNSQEGTN